MRGVSLLLLEGGMEGITRRKMKTGSWASRCVFYFVYFVGEKSFFFFCFELPPFFVLVLTHKK